MRLDLWNAELRGTVTTTRGGVCDFVVLTSADYTLADISAVRFNCSAGEQARHTWVPHLANSTWAPSCAGYVYNPAPVTSSVSPSVNVTNQAHLSGKSHATALGLQTDHTDTSATLLYVTVANVSTDASARAGCVVEHPSSFSVVLIEYPALHLVPSHTRQKSIQVWFMLSTWGCISSVRFFGAHLDGRCSTSITVL
jgi:alpha-L-fucosidase 2